MDRLAEIKKLYFKATPATVGRDLAQAILLLKELPTEEDREKAAVYMDGLSQMRSEWASKDKPGPRPGPAPPARRPRAR